MNIHCIVVTVGLTGAFDTQEAKRKIETAIKMLFDGANSNELRISVNELKEITSASAVLGLADPVTIKPKTTGKNAGK